MVSVFISVGRDGTDGRHGIPGRNGIPGRQGLPGNYNYILVLGLIFFEPRVRESGKFLFIESGIQDFGIWKTYSSRNRESHEQLKSSSTEKDSGFHFLESGIQGLELPWVALHEVNFL